jgi:hypothetical protein
LPYTLRRFCPDGEGEIDRAKAHRQLTDVGLPDDKAASILASDSRSQMAWPDRAKEISRNAGRLSEGQKSRLNLLPLLPENTKDVWLVTVDELEAFLDPRGRGVYADLVNGLLSKEKTVIAATRETTVLLPFARHLVHFIGDEEAHLGKPGTILASGPPESVLVPAGMTRDEYLDVSAESLTPTQVWGRPSLTAAPDLYTTLLDRQSKTSTPAVPLSLTYELS